MLITPVRILFRAHCLYLAGTYYIICNSVTEFHSKITLFWTSTEVQPLRTTIRKGITFRYVKPWNRMNINSNRETGSALLETGKCWTGIPISPVPGTGNAMCYRKRIYTTYNVICYEINKIQLEWVCNVNGLPTNPFNFPRAARYFSPSSHFLLKG